MKERYCFQLQHISKCRDDSIGQQCCKLLLSEFQVSLFEILIAQPNSQAPSDQKMLIYHLEKLKLETTLKGM